MNKLTTLYDRFEALTQEAFGFLENDYGFKLLKTMRDRYSVTMLYQNLTTGIEIEFEPRENKIWLMLYRLISGQLPKYPNALDIDNDLTNRFDLDSLIELKAPGFLARHEGQHNLLSESGLQWAVVEAATALSRYGEGVLTGDFSDFIELGRLKQERLRKMRSK